jgi:predicted LPLAT superfamily acyltransferase
MSADQNWTAQDERSNTLALRIIVWIALRLGRTVARLTLWPITFYFWATAPRARAMSAKYLRKIEAASGRPANSLSTFKHILTFSQIVLDRVFLLSREVNPNHVFDVRMHGFYPMQAVHFAKTGGIFVGAHLGSFEAMRVLGTRDPSAQEALPDLIVRMAMYEENARKINAMLEAINPEAMQYIIALGQPDAMLQLQATIDRAEFVGMLADRDLAQQGEQAADKSTSNNAISFLGEPAWFPTGPFRLAMVLKRPVFLMFGIYHGGNRYDIHFEPLEMPDIAGQARVSRAEHLKQWQAAYVARIEHFCKAAPYNWFNFYDFWSK